MSLSRSTPRTKRHRFRHRCSSLSLTLDETDFEAHNGSIQAGSFVASSAGSYGSISPALGGIGPSPTRLLSEIQSEQDSLSSVEGPRKTAHCHKAVGRVNGENRVDTKARKKLIIASLLVLLFTVAEVLGGYFAHSLAIMTDAAHMFTDFISFMISLLALYLASKPPTKTMSFGWYRAEVVGAVVSILMIWLVTGVLVYLAVQRVISDDFEINATVMLITSATGVAVNLILGLTLQHGHSHGGPSHGHSHGSSHSSSDSDEDIESGTSNVDSNSGNTDRTALIPDVKTSQHSHHVNMNVRAALIHVIGDLVQSLGVLLAAFLIYFKPEWKIADPICTFVFSILVLFTTLTIMRDALNVLMEGTPRGMKFSEVKQSFFEIKGVKDVHDLHVWSLTMSKKALSVHIAIDTNLASYPEALRLASCLVQAKFGIEETTIQIEEYVQEMVDCDDCKDPID